MMISSIPNMFKQCSLAERARILHLFWGSISQKSGDFQAAIQQNYGKHEKPHTRHHRQS